VQIENVSLYYSVLYETTRNSCRHVFLDDACITRLECTFFFQLG